LGAVTFGIGNWVSIGISTYLLATDILNFYNIPVNADTLKNAEALVMEGINNFIRNAPQPKQIDMNNQEVRNELIAIYSAAQKDEELYNLLGADTITGLGQLLNRNGQGNGILQRNLLRSQETALNGLNRLMERRRSSAPPQQPISNKDAQEKSADADLTEDQEYEKIIFDADSIKFEGLADATRNASFGGGFGGSDLGSMIRGDISGLGTGTFRESNTQRNQNGRFPVGTTAAAMAFFISKGWTPEQAAGIVGNLHIESGLNPAAHNKGEDARGIAQWRLGRITNFQRWAGRDIFETPFETQLEFVQFELMGTHRRAAELLRGATTAENAAAIVDQFYEVSAGIHRRERIALARQYLEANQRQPQAQPQTNPTPSTGASLSQAGTNMVAADQQQIRVMQELIDNMAQIGMPEQTQTRSVPNSSPPRTPPAETSLRNRLESAFSYGSIG
jgi:hypothetical protein